MSKEMREQINKVKNWKQFLNEDANNEKTVLIRSKTDDTFRFEISYKNGLIYKIESQGNFVDYMNNKFFIDFITNIDLGKEMNYDYLRTFLSEFPELYVKDIN